MQISGQDKTGGADTRTPVQVSGIIYRSKWDNI